MINIVDKFGPELLVIQFGVLVILITLLMWLWFANRRKYHNLQHAIPANIIKSYLDSIIQNSTALKSNLFRGGGIDVGQIPSVMSLGNLGSGGDGLTVSGSGQAALMDELNQKKAYIAQLESQVNALKNGQKEIEAKLTTTASQLSTAEARIRELEALLAKSKSGGASAGGGAVDAALQAELQNITKERDEIRDRLKEYEIIADDLANLKRLQQENEQLKRSLAEAGGSVPQSAPVEAKTEAKIAEVSDLFEDMASETTGGSTEDLAAELDNLLSGGDSSSEETPVEDVAMAAESEETTESKDKNEKTPDDLLSEFEKMLS